MCVFHLKRLQNVPKGTFWGGHLEAIVLCGIIEQLLYPEIKHCDWMSQVMCELLSFILVFFRVTRLSLTKNFVDHWSRFISQKWL